MSESTEAEVEFSGLGDVLTLARENKPSEFKAAIHAELYSRVNDALVMARKEVAANFLSRDES